MFGQTSVMLCTIILSCLLALPTYADSDSTAHVLKTRQDAENTALAFTGFSKLKECSVDTAKSIKLVITDDQTPFLRDSINGRECWQIEIEARLELEMWITPDSLRDISRKFVVLLDAETGRLVRISSVLAEDYEHKPLKPSAEKAENSLRQMREIFHGFPDEQPVVSFLEALDHVVGSPFQAKEIYAWYVVYTLNDREEPHPVWWIDLRGIPPVHLIDPERGGNTPIEKLNHQRSVIDAKTGQHIRSSNLPG
ncbi:MAG: hypothetical protein U9N55_00210 [candidate division Zixibacteria bacterium]|nr:hypothetical protein [candidate division Zixibacteria bacterium]